MTQKERRSRPVVTWSRLQELLLYDPTTGHFTWARSRQNAPADKIAGHVDGSGHRYIGLEGRLYNAAILAWFYVHGTWPDGLVDHKDGNKDNNALANLEDVSKMVFMARARTRSSKKLIGAYQKPNGRWCSKLNYRGKVLYLGDYDTEIEASKAYLDTRKELGY